MDKRLKNLRKTMDREVFAQLKFTESHKKSIREKIKQATHSDEEILIAIMQLLVQEKTGYQLVSLLQSRGILNFKENEGALYVILHRLELKGILTSNWQEDGAKFYQLNKKGCRLLKKVEEQPLSNHMSFKEIFEG
ncbi:PadR family transcriptional regulator [Priestia megaterium]|jgi:DNA-binding PadR family transcriptional regulator|uniref:Transcriptional regulator, PadR family n=2 Tax=Priestia TaxID=2800373 RepID=D5DZR3_PRIM1|nr:MULTISPECIES: PadR family transcriptional regulator [Priestia]KQU12716.1 PadR family transcriptional regulator [Bacillus sp. Leaf75]KRF56834.1 PadR family transcriptional regulator [Bacillus sp. Soil531]ADE70464.1 transcriptional regulator, PadR family [Priestia megaterium QM B1551]KAA8748798.1 PadR family transcriptional regulator [Priestia megaterium]MBA9037191.1 DNA-binding PadR family transcriptional regulator [Priestia aryabhattai]